MTHEKEITIELCGKEYYATIHFNFTGGKDMYRWPQGDVEPTGDEYEFTKLIVWFELEGERDMVYLTIDNDQYFIDKILED